MKRIKANIAGIQPGGGARTWDVNGNISWGGNGAAPVETFVFPQGDAALALGDKVAKGEGEAPEWEIVALDQNGAVGIIFRIHNEALEYATITITEPAPEPEPEPEPEEEE